MNNRNLSKRWLYLACGVFAMLFSGVLYAWSILKVPFKEVFEKCASLLLEYFNDGDFDKLMREGNTVK